MTEQDLDGDGRPELILPDWQGGLSILKPATGELQNIQLHNLQQASLQTVRGVSIGGDTCWLCAGTKYSMLAGSASQQRALARLYSPRGEILWTFQPELPEGTNSNVCAAVGDIDGDGVAECVIGLTIYVQRPMGENSWTMEDMRGRLIVLDMQGQLIVQREVPQQIDMLYIPAVQAGKPAPLLCFTGGQLERYVLASTDDD